MLTKEENELLCRVGPETPMGRMLRRYWAPVALSEELVPGGAPKDVRLFGEDLVAFRTIAGRVGVFDAHCPHRGASLVLARTEDCGLRCIYHGWKIDVSGEVLEMPAEPEGTSFTHRVRATSYAVREAGGLIWAYLGPPQSEPPFLDFDWTSMPATHRYVLKAHVRCNWVQALEGAIDSAHSGFLHADSIVAAAVTHTVYKTDLVLDRPSDDLRPRFEVEDTAYGFRYAAIRKPLVDPERTKYVRVTLFIAPFYVMFPPPLGFGYMQAFVPIDDESIAFYFIQCSHGQPIDDQSRQRRALRAGMRPGIDIAADFSRSQRRDNRWLQDRTTMATGSYSGIPGVQEQDMAVQESMGPIYDRRKEHLGASDTALIHMRRKMLESVRAFSVDGSGPPGLTEPVDYASLKAEEMLLPIEVSWRAERSLLSGA